MKKFLGGIISMSGLLSCIGSFILSATDIHRQPAWLAGMGFDSGALAMAIVLGLCVGVAGIFGWAVAGIRRGVGILKRGKSPKRRASWGAVNPIEMGNFNPIHRSIA